MTRSSFIVIDGKAYRWRDIGLQRTTVPKVSQPFS
jgi:hypothetical protein